MKNIVLFATVLRIIIITALLGFTIFANAQGVALNATGSSADASAMLDVSSNSKGFLPPRMTTQQRTGISSPATGLMVFDTDTKSYWYFADTWKELNGPGGAFSLPYSGSYATANKVFSIANSGTSPGRVAIYGNGSNVFSGLIASDPIGVWGDEDQGVGVMGTSNGKYGVLGRSSQSHGVYGYSLGASAGIYGTTNNNQGVGVMGFIPGGGIAVFGENNGSQGNAGKFLVSNLLNNSNTVELTTNGVGRALMAQVLNSNSAAEAVTINTNGLGNALGAYILNSGSTANAVRISSQGKGDVLSIASLHNTSDNYLIKGEHNGWGSGIVLTINNANSIGDGIRMLNLGHGAGIRAASKNGSAAVFVNDNNSNISSLILGLNLGMTSVGDFKINNPSNSKAVLLASTDGTGPGLVIDNTNADPVNSLATFKKNSVNKARIDGTGKGFFNGGTQASGADLAEAFDIAGNREDYEPGDVLIISASKDRAVEKSSAPYSTLVSGVYATRPGVLLTEEDIETDISDKVPMGVVGVIPTKVCIEGGEIKRGDLLVTSSIPGVAMKADIDKAKVGQVIGKALENYNSSSVGKIRVLVNVK